MSVMPARPTAERSSFSRSRPSGGPSSGPTALPPPSPRVTVMTPVRRSFSAPHSPYAESWKASSSGWAPMKSAPRSTGSPAEVVASGGDDVLWPPG